MTFIEAAAEVLRQAGKPLHYKEITELAIASNLLSHVGKTPEVTMSHRLTAAVKKDDKDVPIVKLKPGIFALREWDEPKAKKRGTATLADVPGDSGVTEDVSEENDALEVNALEIEAALRGAEQTRDAAAVDHPDDDSNERETPVSGEEALRADLAARGAELFDDEDDDDQPILAPLSQPEATPQADGGRRRRRRRRRGRGGSAGEATGASFAPATDRSSQTGVEASPVQPSPAVPVEADNGGEGRELGLAARPVVRDRQQIMAAGQPTGIDVPLGEGEELAGRELADAIVLVLASFDRNSGPAPVRAIAEALLRRGRLQGDPILGAAQVGASVRADNIRRQNAGQRMRFRFANNARIGLTDWALGGELPRLEQDVLAAVERYREASRRALLRRIQELPGHALIELALVALERVGMMSLKAVRRSGSPGGEAHFSALHKTGGDVIPTAIVVRKDGREIGRERVTDLRGALHHYGPAATGWLVTTGQVLSGAREEAAAAGAPTITLYDGIALCKLLDEMDVGVIKTRFAVAIPDLELLEALRG